MFIGSSVQPITAYAYANDDGAFAINVRYVGDTPDETGGYRRQYGYSIFVEGALLVEGTDVHSGVGETVDARKAFNGLVSFLTNDADKYRTHMGVTTPDDGYSSSEKVAEWAYGVSDELEMIAVDTDEYDDDECWTETPLDEV